MVLLMARPFRRPNTSFIHFRKRVPADIQRLASGKTFTVTIPTNAADEPEIIAAVTLGTEVKFSLRTRDPSIAKYRSGLASAQFERFCANLRAGPQPLTNKQIVALAGLLRREMIADWEDNPGNPEDWEMARDINIDAMESMPALERAVGGGVDRLLAREGIITDEASRRRLLKEAASALAGAASALSRYANGDYRPDRGVDRFPDWESLRPAKAPVNGATGVTIDDLFERWQRETSPSASTITTWRSYMKQLKERVGHDDATQVTKADMIAWKDALVEMGRSPKGIRDGQLAAVRSIFGYGLANDLVGINPAQGVAIRQKKKAGTKMLAYSDAEVADILALANAQKKPDRRWLPWLMALSGARVGELAQLWGDRIVQVHGIWVMKIAPAEDGGSLKNEGSEREVPIHPAIIERGFLSFVSSRGKGPLFYRGGRTKSDRDPGARHASKGVANHLATWIRENGFNDPRKAPNHALRHWFKTACQDAEVQDSVADAIQGHRGSRGEADTYRHASVETMAKAVARIAVPRREVEERAASDGASEQAACR
jgi:integrase